MVNLFLVRQIIPIVCADGVDYDMARPEISRLNYVFFNRPSDDFSASFSMVRHTLQAAVSEHLLPSSCEMQSKLTRSIARHTHGSLCGLMNGIDTAHLTTLRSDVCVGKHMARTLASLSLESIWRCSFAPRANAPETFTPSARACLDEHGRGRWWKSFWCKLRTPHPLQAT